MRPLRLIGRCALVAVSLACLAMLACGREPGPAGPGLEAPAPATSAPAAASAATGRAGLPRLPITKVTIPSISLQAEVVLAPLVATAEGLTWEVPAFKAGHAEGTAGAGGRGNAVLLGHVATREAGNVFADLDKLDLGDVVQVFSDERGFEYRVVDIRTVPRTEVAVVRATPVAVLTLITCTGDWVPDLADYAERLVVRAELVATGDPARAPPFISPIRSR